MMKPWSKTPLTCICQVSPRPRARRFHVVATKEQFSLIATTCFGSRSRTSNPLLQPNAFQVGSSKPCLQFEVAKIHGIVRIRKKRLKPLKPKRGR